jgi:hypothetical protein
MQQNAASMGGRRKRQEGLLVGLLMVDSKPELTLAAMIRSRMAEGAAVREVPAEAMPAWLAAEVGGAAVETVFVSDCAAVALLADGRRVVRRAR